MGITDTSLTGRSMNEFEDPPVSLKPREYKPYYLGLNEVHKSDAVSFLCWEVQLYSVFFFKNFSFRSQKQYLQSRQ